MGWLVDGLSQSPTPIVVQCCEKPRPDASRRFLASVQREYRTVYKRRCLSAADLPTLLPSANAVNQKLKRHVGG